MSHHFPVRMIAALCLAARALAGPVHWSFSVQTTGNDAHWTSPTPADATAPQYDATYAISQVLVDVRYVIFTFRNIDVTDQIPPELLSQTLTLPGPPPITLYDGGVIFPDPPQPVAIGGHLAVTVDAGGFGHADFTGVTLGTYQVDLGPPFGVQTVTIVRVQMDGSVDVTPVHTGDVDRDGDVDLADLARMLIGFGLCSADPGFDVATDLDSSGCTALPDLALLLTNFGRN